MTRKEFLKTFKHLCLLMLCALPILIILNMFCFNGLSNGLVIFLDVLIGGVVVIVVELIIRHIKKNKQNKGEK